MAANPIASPLPADLPTNWTYGQTVAANGADVGLSAQHGYNYLMAQVNAAQTAANALGEALEDTASLDGYGKLSQSEIPNIDCGVWDTSPIAQHNATAATHQNMLVDGNNTLAADSSQSLEEHIVNPTAHQNLWIDGNAQN